MSPITRSESGRLPAWRGTRIEHPFIRLGPGQQGDQLRCFVLHDKPALADASTPERLAAFDDQRVRCELRVVHQHVLALQPLLKLVRSVTKAIRSQGQRSRKIVELQPGFCCVETVPAVLSAEPASGVRERDAQIVERRFFVVGTIGAVGQRQRLRALEMLRNTAFTRPRALRLPARPVRFTASSTTADAGTRVK